MRPNTRVVQKIYRSTYGLHVPITVDYRTLLKYTQSMKKYFNIVIAFSSLRKIVFLVRYKPQIFFFDNSHNFLSNISYQLINQNEILCCRHHRLHRLRLRLLRKLVSIFHGWSIEVSRFATLIWIYLTNIVPLRQYYLWTPYELLSITTCTRQQLLWTFPQGRHQRFLHDHVRHWYGS